MATAYAVILAGGRGERFWPLSTHQRPKQFLTLFGGKPLLQQAVERVEGVIPPERTLVITSADLVALTCEAIPAVPAENVVGEPCGRDTAAACALACALAQRRDPDAVVCILTADQIMRDASAFRRTLADAIAVAAAHEVIVTIGIEPTAPSTGFGYIQTGAPFAAAADSDFRRVERFVEKPDLDTAKRYLADGRHLWNAGMFIWRTRVMRRALAAFAPALDALCDRIVGAEPGAMEIVLAEAYPGLKKISVDYAVMERADNLVVARGMFGWDDVGSWTSVADHLPPDATGNTVAGRCQALDAAGNIVVAWEGRVVALLGVRDLIVVTHGDVILVCHKDRAQDVKKLAQQVAAAGGGASLRGA